MVVDKREDDSFYSWSREQDKAFENAIATYSEDILDRWEKIAENVPGKSLEELKKHYELLIDDITEIESGRVPLPCYISYSDGSSNIKGEGNVNFDGEMNSGSRGSKSEQERRKGIAWTEDEHKLFLLGLEKYGKGDWRSISRNFVVTRTPTQVASHAQKYFIRMNSVNKERRRSSIHDITNLNGGDAPQGPITGQTNSPATGATDKPSKLPNQTPPPVMGQPIGPAAHAVGTPVSISPPAHMAYGVRAPMHGLMVQGSPMNVGPITYPMPHR